MMINIDSQYQYVKYKVAKIYFSVQVQGAYICRSSTLSLVGDNKGTLMGVEQHYTTQGLGARYQIKIMISFEDIKLNIIKHG